jgi:hypothetical protein
MLPVCASQIDRVLPDAVSTRDPSELNKVFLITSSLSGRIGILLPVCASQIEAVLASITEAAVPAVLPDIVSTRDPRGEIVSTRGRFRAGPIG